MMIDCLLSTFSLTICSEDENIRLSDRAPSKGTNSDAKGKKMSKQETSFLDRAVYRRTVLVGTLGVLASPLVSRLAYAAAEGDPHLDARFG